MKIIHTLLAAFILTLLTACGGTSNETSSTEEAFASTNQQETSPTTSDQQPLVEPNLAEGFNEAWADLVAAQQAYDALGSIETVTETTVTNQWINQVGDRLEDVRAAWQVMKAEADQLPLPRTFTTKGEMSRGTVDEYMDAYDEYLSLQEASYDSTEQCVADGGEPYGCVFTVGIEFLSNEEYIAAWERLRQATYAIFDEAQQPGQ